MTRGPKPKPNHLKIAAGNPGKRAIDADREPKIPIDETAEPPRRIRGKSRAEWRRISKVLKEAGLLTKVDRNALALYCDAYELYVEALEMVREQGQVITTDKNFPMQNPWLANLNKQREAMGKLLAEFGMTPSSRTRVQVAPPQGAPDDEWDDLD